MTDATESTEIVEKAPFSYFVSEGVLPLARQVNAALVQAGHRLTGMAHDSASAAAVREDGGLPVYPLADNHAEITRMMALGKADSVLHLAPAAAYHPPFVAPRLAPDALLANTRALVEAAKASDVRFFLFLSLAAAYGDTGETPADEAVALSRSDEPLVAAVRQAEALVAESGIPYTILRVGYIYGPESEVLRDAAAALRAGRPIHVGTGHNSAPWVATADLVSAVTLAATSQPQDAVLNIAGAEAMTPGDFVNLLATAQGMQPPGGITALLKLLSRPQTTQRLAFSTRINSEKARETLGWQPRFDQIQDGVEDLLLSWRAMMAH